MSKKLIFLGAETYHLTQIHEIPNTAISPSCSGFKEKTKFSKPLLGSHKNWGKEKKIKKQDHHSSVFMQFPFLENKRFAWAKANFCATYAIPNKVAVISVLDPIQWKI